MPSNGNFLTDKIGLTSKVVSVSGKANLLEPSVSNVPNIEKTNGIKLKDYYDCIQEISKLINNYKELLKRDTKDILKANDAFFEMDKDALTNILKTR